jgi:lactate dehydrogenase-like 2-hydroxyacid dehydrogenase
LKAPVRQSRRGSIRVIATRALPGSAFSELDDVAVVSLAELQPSPGVEALIVLNESVCDRELDLLPDLRLVANYGAGYERIDVSSCNRRGVVVTNTPGVVDAATADLAIALLLAAQRRLVESDRDLRRGIWKDPMAEEQFATEFSGSVLGIIGLGGIGKAVARRAAGFEVRLVYTKRARLGRSDEKALGVEWRALDDLLHEADSVTLHVPKTAETTGLLDARRLGYLRDGAVIVNTARGDVIVREALLQELSSGRIRAGLDVFWDEPNVPPELLQLPNVVLTGHIGTATHAARHGLMRVVVDNILAVAEGRPPITPVVCLDGEGDVDIVQ